MFDVVEQSSRIHVGDFAPSALRVIGAVGLSGDLVAFRGGGRPFIDQSDAQILIEEGHLMKTFAQRLEIVVDRLEDLGVRPERLTRPMFIGGFASPKRTGRHAVFKRDPPYVAVTPDFGLHAARQRIDHGDADAVQSARNGVTAVAELPSRVEDRHDDFDCRTMLGRMVADGNPAAVVAHAHAAVSQDRHFDVVAVSRQGLIHRIVHDFVYAVVKAALTGRPDVHAGTFAHSFETFENRNRRGVVRLFIGDSVHRGGLLLFSFGLSMRLVSCHAWRLLQTRVREVVLRRSYLAVVGPHTDGGFGNSTAHQRILRLPRLLRRIVRQVTVPTSPLSFAQYTHYSPHSSHLNLF